MTREQLDLRVAAIEQAAIVSVNWAIQVAQDLCAYNMMHKDSNSVFFVRNTQESLRYVQDVEIARTVAFDNAAVVVKEGI
jgi:hypothetical protein